MKRIEENGAIYYQWEPEDQNRQADFEKAVLAEKAIEPILKAMLVAQGWAGHEVQKAWRQVGHLIGSSFPGDGGPQTPLSYDWINQRFRRSLHSMVEGEENPV